MVGADTNIHPHTGLCPHPAARRAYDPRLRRRRPPFPPRRPWRGADPAPGGLRSLRGATGASRAVRCRGGGPARRARCGLGAVVRAGRHFAGSVEPAVRVTLRHGERLRLRLRLRLRRRGWRWGQAGPGAHHGAGEGADRRGQRAGALAAHDRQVLSEVHREARRRAGQLGAEVHRHVHGPVYGRLERRFQSLQLSAAAGESQHVKRPGSWTREGPCGEGTRGQSSWLAAKFCHLASPCHGRAINSR